MFKKVKMFITTMLLILGLTACQDNPMSAIYDNDSKIVSDSNVYNLTNDEQNIEKQNYKGSIEKFEGMDTIWTYNATEDENVELKYLAAVYSGKMKLVLIAPDNSLTTIVEITSETDLKDYQTYMLELKEGTNRIKVIGGENTKLDIELSIPIGEFHELG